VLVLYEEEPGNALLCRRSHGGAHLLDLLFETARSLPEQRNRLAGREGRQEGEPGCELRELLRRDAQELAQPVEELHPPLVGQPVDRPLRTPALADRLERFDQCLPLQSLHHRVERAVSEPDRLVLGPLAHHGDHLIGVHRPLVK
jgi:hypothetical protein